MNFKTLAALGLILLLVPQQVSSNQKGTVEDRKKDQRLTGKAERKLRTVPWDLSAWQHTGKINLDSLKVQSQEKRVNLYFSPQLTHIPVRHEIIESIEQPVKSKLGRRFSDYTIQLYSRNQKVEEYIPNLYRHGALMIDTSRFTLKNSETPLIQKSYQNQYPSGLSGRHIAIWPGHGWYFEQKLDRWEWQRARLFQTVEDLFPYTIVRNYLAPMLENSGAYIFLPRERCTQRHEIIVDNDGSTGNSKLIINNGTHNWETRKTNGFAWQEVLLDGQNPFTMGSHLSVQAGGKQPATLTYAPEIPEDGEYGVYIAWAASDQNVENVSCQINYAGGTAIIQLNQKMGYGTWIYLGAYFFKEGVHPETASLIISSAHSGNGIITADAVRFGGGMGNIARGIQYDSVPLGIPLRDSLAIQTLNAPQTSGRPRYMEGARYFLQYSGMPDTLVYSFNQGNKDYNDDYMSRGEWVNYLMGAPNGPTGHLDEKGLGVPIDLSLAFHTDAGITPNDSVIGTLAIYSTRQNNGFFPEGQSRLASRDLSDIIQTQIVTDLRAKYNEQWTRRGLWDRQYSEAWRPNAPAMLLELLSHQNMADMKYGLDPRFQFDVSRAIYKGMLRFIRGAQAVVQPLPPASMQIEWIEGKRIRLRWQAVPDSIEPSATPQSYKVYCRSGDEGFDTGTETTNNYLKLELPEYGTIYSFKVTGLNDGGESFPGETLSVGLIENNNPEVLIVNGFDRISGPSWFNNGAKAGIDWWEDEGVPYGIDYSKTGNQYDYNPKAQWLDDDSPGWGASYANAEGFPIPGNSFDFTTAYGEAFLEAGRSYISISDEAFEALPQKKLLQYNTINLIFGEERGTASFNHSQQKEFRVFTPGLIRQMELVAQNQGNLLLSGAYIGTDMVENSDSLAIGFARKVLGYKWRTNQATIVGEVTATPQAELFLPPSIHFNTSRQAPLYTVEAPDAIEPAGENAYQLYRYSSNNSGAAVFFNGNHKAITFGFPLETITRQAELNTLINQILNIFEQHNNKP